MNASHDIVAYTYRADLYCGRCVTNLVLRDWLTNDWLVPVEILDAAPGESYEDDLNWLAPFHTEVNIDREREETFDSDDFPKVVFRDQLDPANDDACAGCEEHFVWEDD